MTNIFFYNIMASGIAFIIVLTVTLIFPVLAKRKELEVGSLFSSSVGGLGKKMTNGWKNLHKKTSKSSGDDYWIETTQKASFQPTVSVKSKHNLVIQAPKKKDIATMETVKSNANSMAYKRRNDDSQIKTIQKAAIQPTVSVKSQHNVVIPKASKKKEIAHMETVKLDANSLAYRRRHHRGEQRHHQQPESVPWRKVRATKLLNFRQMEHFLMTISQGLKETQEKLKGHENFPYHRYSQASAKAIFDQRAGWGWVLLESLHEINDVLTEVLLSQGSYQRAFGKAVWAQIRKRIYFFINRSRLMKNKIEAIYQDCFPEYQQFTSNDALRDHRQTLV